MRLTTEGTGDRNSWINLNALWKIVVSACSPAPVCPRCSPSDYGRSHRAPASRPGSGTAAETDGRPARQAGRGALLRGVLAAMAWGVYSIVHNS